MNVGIVTNVPPFSSMHVQHVVGGFVCVVPPGAPVVSKDSNGVATAMHMFLGQEDVSERSSARPDNEKMKFDWPPATVPQGSVFNVSKVARVHNGRVQLQGGFMLSYHAAMQNTGGQIATFNRAAVMDKLRTWITIEPPQQPVQAEQALVTLAGMRTNPDMDPDGEAVFVMRVAHASQVEDFAGPCPFVARSNDPHMAIGVVDEEVVGYLAEELGQDLQGNFAARVHEAFLEFGPRVEEE